MSATEHPNITCTKCSTVVSWRPHCPYCHAYLEFSGNPPWHPDPPTEEPEETLTEPDTGADWSAHDATPPPETLNVDHPEDFSDSGLVSQAEQVTVLPVSTINSLPLEVDEADAIADAALEQMPKVREPSAITLMFRGLRRDPDRHVVGYLAALTVAIILILLFGRISGTTGAAIAAPLFIGWALVSIAIFGTIPDQREFEIAEAEAARLREEEERERARLAREEELRALAEAALLITEAPPLLAKVQDDEAPIEARAPQTVAATVERSAPIQIQEEKHDETACSSCGRMNLTGRSFCAQCGEVLEGSQVAPSVVAISLSDSEQQAEEARKKKIQVSSSWRTPIFAITIAGVVIGALAFAFLGPGAFQLRFGMTRAFQIINQWIDPYSGRAVTIETVVASSTLPGTDAQQIGTSDARTFWASAPSRGYGAGTTLTYTLAQATEIDRMVIFPGIQSAQFDSRALASPKEITLTFDDGTEAKATLASLDLQSDSRQLVQFPQNVTLQIKLTIDSVYPPRGESEDGVGSVAISGTQFLEVPQPPKVFGFQNGVRTPGVPGVSNNSGQ